MIFQDQHILKIDNLQANLFEGKIATYDEYLANAAVVFSQQMLAYFGNDILLHKLYYIDEFSKNSKYTTIPCCEDIYSQSTDSSLIMTTINQLENKVKNRKTNSFITLVHRKKLRTILCHRGSVNPFSEDSGFFTFSLGSNNVDFHTKMDVGVLKNYSPILDAYRDVSKKISTSIYFYVLKSTNLDKEFNGALLLITRRSINRTEYDTIADFFTFLMQARIKYEYKKALKDAEWKKIIEQITHSKYNQRAVLNDNSEDFLQRLKEQNLNDLVQIFESNEQMRKSVDRIDDFSFALYKVEYDRNNIAILKQRSIEKLLHIEMVSLGDVLEEQIMILQGSLKTVPFKNGKIKKNVKAFLPKFKEKIYHRFSNKRLGVVKEGLKIILLDLLKNAIKEVKEDAPEIDIQLYEFNANEIDSWAVSNGKFAPPSVPYMTLAFTNNKPIVRKDQDGVLERTIYDNLLDKLTDSNTSTTRQLGVRIVKQITNYNGLGKSGLQWYYTPSTECLNCEYTKILLLIPKSDFEYDI